MEDLGLTENYSDYQRALFGYYIDSLNHSVNEFNLHNDHQFEPVTNPYFENVKIENLALFMSDADKLLVKGISHSNLYTLAPDETVTLTDIPRFLNDLKNNLGGRILNITDNGLEIDQDIINEFKDNLSSDSQINLILEALSRSEFSRNLCNHFGIDRNIISNVIENLTLKRNPSASLLFQRYLINDLFVCEYTATPKAAEGIDHLEFLRFVGFNNVARGIDYIQDLDNQILLKYQNSSKDKVKWTDQYMLEMKTGEWTTPSPNLKYSINITSI